MGADVKRGLDTLRHDHLRLQVLRVIHPVAGIADPSRGMHVHDVAHVDYFHRWTLPARRRLLVKLFLALPAALRVRDRTNRNASCRLTRALRRWRARAAPISRRRVMNFAFLTHLRTKTNAIFRPEVCGCCADGHDAAGGREGIETRI